MTLKPNIAVGWISDFCKEAFVASGVSDKKTQLKADWLALRVFLCVQRWQCLAWSGSSDVTAKSGARLEYEGNNGHSCSWTYGFVFLVQFRKQVLLEAENPWIYDVLG